MKGCSGYNRRIFLTDPQVLSHQYGIRGALRI